MAVPNKSGTYLARTLDVTKEVSPLPEVWFKLDIVGTKPFLETIRVTHLGTLVDTYEINHATGKIRNNAGNDLHEVEKYTRLGQNKTKILLKKIEDDGVEIERCEN